MIEPWLEETRERDPEVYDLIVEQRRLERIGWEVLKREGGLHQTPLGFGASWGECHDAAARATDAERNQFGGQA